MKRLTLAAVLLAGTAFATMPAKADIADVTLGGFNWSFNGVNTLTLSNAVPAGNQVKNLPCIICGENQPLQPAGFGYNDFGNTGNASNLPFFSSGVVDKTLGPDTLGAINYGGAFLQAFDPALTFSIGIDVNMANGQPRQTLESFFFLDVTDKTVLAAFINRSDGNLFAPNNGTGFPDMTLTGLSLAGINPDHEFAFFARISGATDGPDSFFFQQAAVPGPVVGAGIPGMIAACGGLFGLNFWRRRRNGTLPA